MRMLLLAAAASVFAAERTGVELAVRVEEGGTSTVQSEAPPIDLNAWLAGGRDYVFRGRAGGAEVDWKARRTVTMESGERVEGYRIEAEGLEAALLPLHVDRGDYRLVVVSSGTGVSLRLDPEAGGSATEFLVSGPGADLRTRTVGARSVLAGEADPAGLDAQRLAAVGAALALIRLDPPLRRRGRVGAQRSP